LSGLEFYIKEYRNSKGISLNELSKMTGISASYLSEIENNKKFGLAVINLCKISDALGVPPYRLFRC